MSKITSTKDMQIDYAKVVVYGPPGAGKTIFGATFPDALILSAESGLLSVRDQDIDVWEVKTWEDIEEAFRYLHTEDHGYKTVVLDSLSEVQKKLNEHIVRKFPAKKRDYEDLMSMSDWGYSIDRLRKMCRAFRDLPMNVVFIALSQEVMMEEELMVKPALSGKTLSDELAGWVDAVIYCPGPQKDEEGHVQYLGQTVPGRGRMAKVRVPADVDVPSYIHLTFKALQGIMFPELNKKEEDNG